MSATSETNEKHASFDYARDKLDDFVDWIAELYTHHPRENGMTGIQHFLFAMKLGGITMISALLLAIHAVAPWCLTTTGGDLLLYASETLKNSRQMEDSLSANSDTELNVEVDTDVDAECESDNENESNENIIEEDDDQDQEILLSEET